MSQIVYSDKESMPDSSRLQSKQSKVIPLKNIQNSQKYPQHQNVG